ncbi:DUF4260 domain-containing protein [Nesterenkonia muleiensis]|uniref:DUF4260 domain-containing protein n=1 Tax=Nesterenkonia muleiensis TaxID=2282648 RepID=UPI001EE3DF7D|nr:DUF4260 domain-containing protein [Nesterenkonia muleiensis]
MSAEGSATSQTPHRQALIWQRAENTAIALGVVLVVIALGQPWWVLLAAFLVFDLSALGYLISQRAGALCYNLVHNYTVPAALIAVWAVLQWRDAEASWLVLLAACWVFHVAVDRALGYGLKLGPFKHTHLGIIGKQPQIPEDADSPLAPQQRRVPDQR